MNDQMSLTSIIGDFAESLGLELKALQDEETGEAIHPEAYLKSRFPPSYYYFPLRKESHGDLPAQLRAHAWEEITHSRHGGTIFTDGHPDDTKRKILGINLCGLEVDDRFEAAFSNIPAERMDLKGLSLAESHITSFSLTPEMKGLVHLELSRNENLEKVTFGEGLSLSHLKTFDAYECRLKEIALPKGMDQLFRLDLARNQELSHVSFQEGCPSLFTLDLSNNALSSLHLPRGFSSLGYIYAHDNRLESLTFSDAKDFSALVNIHVRNNQLKRIPANFLDFPSLNNFFAHGNPFTGIPEEVIDSSEYASSYTSVKNYLEGLRDEGEESLHEAKMILIGNGMAGKTSLLKKLLDKEAELPEAEDRTAGLDIQPYPIQLKRDSETINFMLNGWDFGGQGKYREVQQLFCSRKSLYIFVEAEDEQKEGEEDYVGYSYWLNMALAYGYDEKEKEESPVLYVRNKIDKHDGDAYIDEGKLKIEYPQIKKFLKISCLELNRYMDEFLRLEKAIHDSVPSISQTIFTDKYPKNWLEVKNELEKRRHENHISREEYLKICEGKGLNEEQAETWLDILDRIGTVIYFRKHDELKDWIILNPIWVRDAIFKVIDSNLVRNGILRPEYFNYIWERETDEGKTSYTNEEHAKFIALMEAYKLSYKDEEANEYIVPSCLSEKPPKGLPEEIEEGEPAYRFKLAYEPFIPAGMVNKLIVKVLGAWKGSHEEMLAGEFQQKARMPKEGGHLSRLRILDNKMWRHHVILQDTSLAFNAFALVKEVWKDRAVYLELYGHPSGMKPLLETLLAMLQGILQDLIDTKRIKKLGAELQVYRDHSQKYISCSLLEEEKVDIWKRDKEEETKSPLDEVRELLGTGDNEDIKSAISILKRVAGEDYQSEVIGFLGRINRITKHERKNNRPPSEIEVSRNRLIEDILGLCLEIEADLRAVDDA